MLSYTNHCEAVDLIELKDSLLEEQLRKQARDDILRWSAFP